VGVFGCPPFFATDTAWLANEGDWSHFVAMQIPRWFQIVVAVCLIVLSLDATLYLIGPARDHRYSGGSERFSVVDGRTGRMCQMNGPTDVVCWHPVKAESAKADSAVAKP
jgi:hypothetical protein